jgi:hypothetical protein
MRYGTSTSGAVGSTAATFALAGLIESHADIVSTDAVSDWVGRDSVGTGAVGLHAGRLSSRIDMLLAAATVWRCSAP